MLEDILEELDNYYSGEEVDIGDWSQRISELPRYIPLKEVRPYIKRFLDETNVSYSVYAGLIGVRKRTVVDWMNPDTDRNISRHALLPLVRVSENYVEDPRKLERVDYGPAKPYFEAYAFLSEMTLEELSERIAEGQPFASSTVRRYLSDGDAGTVPKVINDYVFKDLSETHGVNTLEAVKEVLRRKKQEELEKEFNSVQLSDIIPSYNLYLNLSGRSQSDIFEELRNSTGISFTNSTLETYLGEKFGVDNPEKKLSSDVKEFFNAKLESEFNIREEQVEKLYESVQTIEVTEDIQQEIWLLLYLKDLTKEELSKELSGKSILSEQRIYGYLKERGQKQRLSKLFLEQLDGELEPLLGAMTSEDFEGLIREAADYHAHVPFREVSDLVKTYVYLSEEDRQILEWKTGLIMRESPYTMRKFLSPGMADSDVWVRRILKSKLEQILETKYGVVPIEKSHFYAMRYDYENTYLDKEEMVESFEIATTIAGFHPEILVRDLTARFSRKRKTVKDYINPNNPQGVPKKIKDYIDSLVVGKARKDNSLLQNDAIKKYFSLKSTIRTGDYFLRDGVFSRVHSSVFAHTNKD